MLDRASTFADDEVITLLQQRFIPVAANASHHDWVPDSESKFYRKVVYQREGVHQGITSQGFYIFAPDGRLISGWNNRDTDKVKRLLKAALANYQGPAQVEALSATRNRNFTRVLPDGGMVVDVFSKITDAQWPPAKDKWEGAFFTLFRAATGRDHLWVTREEIVALAHDTMPDTLTRRIALYHLIDNTRGEPPMWKDAELRTSKITVTAEGSARRIEGNLEATTSGKDRHYRMKILGYVETKDDQLVRFDLVARGQFQGHGQYTAVGAPQGVFTLAIAFTLADQTTEASKVAPQGFNADEYLTKDRPTPP